MKPGEAAGCMLLVGVAVAVGAAALLGYMLAGLVGSYLAVGMLVVSIALLVDLLRGGASPPR